MKPNINKLTNFNTIIPTQTYSTLIGSSINPSIYTIPPTLKSPARSEENERIKKKKDGEEEEKKENSHYLVPEIGSAINHGNFFAGKKSLYKQHLRPHYRGSKISARRSRTQYTERCQIIKHLIEIPARRHRKISHTPA